MQAFLEAMAPASQASASTTTPLVDLRLDVLHELRVIHARGALVVAHQPGISVAPKARTLPLA